MANIMSAVWSICTWGGHEYRTSHRLAKPQTYRYIINYTSHIKCIECIALGNAQCIYACKPALGLRVLFIKVVIVPSRGWSIKVIGIRFYTLYHFCLRHRGAGGLRSLARIFSPLLARNQVVLKTDIFLSSFLFFLKKMITSCLRHYSWDCSLAGSKK